VAETNRRDVVLRGVAFGGTSPVSKVEVRIGDGAWQPAQIAPPQELQSNPLVREAWQSLEEATWPLQGVWTPWRLPWHVPAAGEYVVRVRATNAAGEVQQEVDPRAIDGFSQQAVGTIRVS